MHAAFLIAALAIASPPDRPNPTPMEAKPLKDQLPGEWQIVAALTSGKPNSAMKPGEVVFVFDGDRMIIRRPTGDNVYRFTIDPAKSPVAFDVTRVSLKGVESKGSPIVGIAKLEGGVLSLCFRPAGPRPSSFVSDADTKSILWQVRRGKK